MEEISTTQLWVMGGFAFFYVFIFAPLWLFQILEDRKRRLMSTRQLTDEQYRDFLQRVCRAGLKHMRSRNDSPYWDRMLAEMQNRNETHFPKHIRHD